MLNVGLNLRIEREIKNPKRFTALPRPFLRWAGSKQAILPHIVPLLPASFETYFEPFLGSGALFFYLQPHRAVLSDAGTELIETWLSVRDNIDCIVDYLGPLKPNRDLFYQIRESRSAHKGIRAAEFLYLNKTCWNGLYRVNAKGKFNVPYGAPKTDFIFDEKNLRACSAALATQGVDIRCGDFALSVIDANADDFVYFDPPYVTAHNCNGFRDWNEKIFSWNDQVRLATEAERLRNRGVKVIVSNASHPDLKDLYNNFRVVEIERSSTLSSSKKFRGRVKETIFMANI